jgi:hypothetical protein
LIAACGFVPPQLCLPTRGGSGNLADSDDAKALVKCQSKVKKIATAFVTKKLKSLEKCVDAIFRCIQTSAADDSCVSTEEGDGKAEEKCEKEFAKIEAAAAKVAPAIEKACGGLPSSALFEPNGANLASLATECDNVGVTVSDLPSFSDCVVKHHHCEAEELLNFEAPTADSLLRLIDRDLFSDFCD